MPDIKQWLKHGQFGDVLQQHIPQENVMTPDENGLLNSNHAYFLQHRDAFRIIFGFDEAQMYNPIGFKATSKYNLGMIYWTIANIHPMYRSNLKFLNFAGIVKSEDIQKYVMDAVLAPIVQNIQLLADGVELENGEIIRGNLFAVSGDNLGQHKLCGLKEGFTAAHPCMVCEASLNQVQTLVTEDTNLIRTPENYYSQPGRTLQSCCQNST